MYFEVAGRSGVELVELVLQRSKKRCGSSDLNFCGKKYDAMIAAHFRFTS